MSENKTTLLWVLKCLREDNIQRRKYLEKSTGWKGELAGLLSHIMHATIIYRFSNYFFKKRLRFFSKVLYGLNIVVFGCDISPMSEIGPGFVLLHLVGTIIHGKIGENALLYGSNGIGGLGGESKRGWYGGPVIGDNLIMYHGAKIMATITVGDDVTIGAMTLVLKPVPSNQTIVGIPARPITRQNCEGGE